MVRKLQTAVFISLYILLLASLVEFGLTAYLLGTKSARGIATTPNDQVQEVLVSLATTLGGSLLSVVFVIIHTILAWKSRHDPSFTVVRNPLHITNTWILRFVVIFWFLATGFGLDIVAKHLNSAQEQPEEDPSRISYRRNIYRSIIFIATLLPFLSWTIAVNIKINERPYATSLFGVQSRYMVRQFQQSRIPPEDSSRDNLLRDPNSRDDAQHVGTQIDRGRSEQELATIRTPLANSRQSQSQQRLSSRHPFPQERLRGRGQRSHPSQTRRPPAQPKRYTNFLDTRARRHNTTRFPPQQPRRSPSSSVESTENHTSSTSAPSGAAGPSTATNISTGFPLPTRQPDVAPKPQGQAPHMLRPALRKPSQTPPPASTNGNTDSDLEGASESSERRVVRWEDQIAEESKSHHLQSKPTGPSSGEPGRNLGQG